MWLITIFLGAVVYFLINYWINSELSNWKKRGIPYHPSASPFRMFYKFMFTKNGFLELIKEDYERLEGYKFSGYFQMFVPAILIRDIDLIHKILIKDFSHFVDRSLPSTVADLFSESVSMATGDKWRRLRQKLTPTFTSGKLKLMFGPITECCDEVVAFIDKSVGKDIEIRDTMFKYSINVIGKVSFGLKVDALNDEASEFLAVSRKFFQPSFLLMIKFMITMVMPKLRKYIRYSMIDESIGAFFKTLVSDMIAHREKTGEVRNDFLQLMLDQKKKEEADSLHPDATDNKVDNSLQNQAEEPEDNELLDQLKNMGKVVDNSKTTKVFTDDCIVAQTFMFISGGSETVATALSFIFYELAINSDCQKKLQDEIDNLISENGFTYNAVKNMKYVEQVLEESLRLHTVAASLSRICTQDYKIPDTDIIIEKGSVISLPINGINFDPKYFPNPLKFDPDRFQDISSMHPATVMSFGAGPRMCIAKRLAILEVKMVVAAVLHRFTVSLSPKTKLPLRIIKGSIFQHVEGGLWVQFQKRT